MLDGLDDIEEQYLIPEALRRADAKTLDENFFKPCNHLLAVHQEFRHELEALTRAGWSLGFTCRAEHRARERRRAQHAGLRHEAHVRQRQARQVGHQRRCGETGLTTASIWTWRAGSSASSTRRKSPGRQAATPAGVSPTCVGEPWLEAKVRRLDSVSSPQSIKSPDELWALLYSRWLAFERARWWRPGGGRGHAGGIATPLPWQPGYCTAADQGYGRAAAH